MWRYEDFQGAFLAVCHQAALKEPEIENDGGELALERAKLAEVEKKMAFLLETLEGGESAGIRKRYDEREKEQQKLREHIAELETKSLAKPIQVSTIDWTDAAKLRDNLRATVRRITVSAKDRWFRAEFFDGRVYECQKNPDGTVTIKHPQNEAYT